MGLLSRCSPQKLLESNRKTKRDEAQDHVPNINSQKNHTADATTGRRLYFTPEPRFYYEIYFITNFNHNITPCLYTDDPHKLPPAS